MVPLYTKTVYSFLSSLITIDDLINLAREKHLDALGICDDNMYGAMEFITKCLSNGINPIVGLELDKCLLYAKNYLGYQNLIKLSTINSEREITLDDLDEYSSNLICFDKTKENELNSLFEDYYPYDEKFHPIRCLREEDIETLKYLNMLRDNKKISDEYNFDSNCLYHSIDNKYEEITRMCSLILPKYPLNLPNYSDFHDTKGLNSDEYLYNLSIMGLNKRLDGKVTLNYKNRLLLELDVIKKMGFSNYFLIVYDFIKYAKSNNILVGPGRGSAAGSLVGYSLGITEVDPLKYDLLFERFLNIERITMPDIDTDFPDERRDDVIKYVEEKYGKKNVSQIVTFGTFGSKMALRDMGRILNVPNYILDDLIRKIGDKSLDEALSSPEIKNYVNSDNKVRKLYQVALRIEGLPRHSSIHAAGVIMANNLNDYVPLVFNDDKYVCAYEAKYLEALGLLKMDFLGIRNLTIIDNILSMLGKTKNISLKFNDIPLMDEKTNRLFQNGDTLGIFQFESRGMRDFLVKLKPENFEDIYNANAFFRPGPSANIDTFIKRRHGLIKTEYYDSRLKDILKGTCGLIVYQEQIMQIANVMAGFTLGEADILRRAMSKKKREEILKYQEKFIKQAIDNGYSEELVHKIFNLILEFASYGFNKSHSVAYSMISYKMAYLKANYPEYFYLAILDGSREDEEKLENYLKEMKKNNIKILKPDINRSMNNYTLYYDKIVLPFSIIKGIGTEVSKKIIESRGEGFKDIYDFFIKLSSIPKNVLELLINSGTLDSFSYNRNTLFQNMENLINYGNLVNDLGEENVLKPEIEMYEEYSRDKLITLEKASFGFYLTNHPVSFYKSKMKAIDLKDIKKYFNRMVTCIVLIDKIKEITTKKNEKMAFIKCSDEEGTIDVTVFPKLYDKLESINKNDIVMITGKVERRSDYNIILESIECLKE